MIALPRWGELLDLDSSRQPLRCVLITRRQWGRSLILLNCTGKKRAPILLTDLQVLPSREEKVKVGWVVSAMRGLVQGAVGAHNKGNPSQWRRSDCLPEFVRCLQFTSVFHLHCCTDPQTAFGIFIYKLEYWIMSSVMNFQISHCTDQKTEDWRGEVIWTKLVFKFRSFYPLLHITHLVWIFPTSWHIRSGKSEVLSFIHWINLCSLINVNKMPWHKTTCKAQKYNDH